MAYIGIIWHILHVFIEKINNEIYQKKSDLSQHDQNDTNGCVLPYQEYAHPK